MLDKRRAHLLSIILQQSKPVHVKHLTDEMGVSQRTIYYDLDQLNDWLSLQKLEPIQNIYGKGFWLPDSTRMELRKQNLNLSNESEYQFSEKERVFLLLAKLLTDNDHLTMKRFMSITQMSRGTVVKDLQKVKDKLDEYHLTLHFSHSDGYQVYGLEENKRKLLSTILSYILLNKEWYVIREKVYSMIYPNEANTNQDLQEREDIIQIISKTEYELGLTLTDEMVEMLTIQLLIVMKRIHDRQLVTIDSEEKTVLQETKYYQSAQFIAKRLFHRFQVAIPEDEICFLTMHLLGLKVHHDDFSNYSKRELSGLKNVAHRMVTEFQKNACVIFDDREGLEKNLISHIKPTYYRLKYGVSYSDNLTKSIKKNYPDIFHFTKRVIVHLEYYVGKTIPEEEIAYISLHFGGWLTKEKKRVNVKYKAIIVCENGIGTSNMLKTQIESLIAGLEVVSIQSIREFNAQEQKVDVVLSTNYIKEKDIPVIHVPAILSNVDKERILQQINELFNDDYSEVEETEPFLEAIKQYATIHDQQGLKEALSIELKEHTHQAKEIRKPMLNELLTEKTIQFKDRVTDWEEAIKVAAEPLVSQKIVKSKYVQAMIDNVKDLGPYIVIAPNIALPHARPETGVESLGISFLRLKEPVYFSEKEKHRAQLIIVLAAIDNETHLKALSQLTELLSDEKNMQLLIDATKPEDVLNLIK